MSGKDWRLFPLYEAMDAFYNARLGFPHRPLAPKSAAGLRTRVTVSIDEMNAGGLREENGTRTVVESVVVELSSTQSGMNHQLWLVGEYVKAWNAEVRGENGPRNPSKLAAKMRGAIERANTLKTAGASKMEDEKREVRVVRSLARLKAAEAIVQRLGPTLIPPTFFGDLVRETVKAYRPEEIVTWLSEELYREAGGTSATPASALAALFRPAAGTQQAASDAEGGGTDAPSLGDFYDWACRATGFDQGTVRDALRSHDATGYFIARRQSQYKQYDRKMSARGSSGGGGLLAEIIDGLFDLGKERAAKQQQDPIRWRSLYAKSRVGSDARRVTRAYGVNNWSHLR